MTDYRIIETWNPIFTFDYFIRQFPPNVSLTSISHILGHSIRRINQISHFCDLLSGLKSTAWSKYMISLEISDPSEMYEWIFFSRIAGKLLPIVTGDKRVNEAMLNQVLLLCVGTMSNFDHLAALRQSKWLLVD